MAKKAISLTLDELNLLWLRDQTIRKRARNLSEAVDAVVTEARLRTWGPPRLERSIVGSIEIPDDDPDLEKMQKSVRELFDESLARTAQALKEHRVPVVRERRTAYGKPRRKSTRG